MSWDQLAKEIRFPNPTQPKTTHWLTTRLPKITGLGGTSAYTVGKINAILTQAKHAPMGHRRDGKYKARRLASEREREATERMIKDQSNKKRRRGDANAEDMNDSFVLSSSDMQDMAKSHNHEEGKKIDDRDVPVFENKESAVISKRTSVAIDDDNNERKGDFPSMIAQDDQEVLTASQQHQAFLNSINAKLRGRLGPIAPTPPETAVPPGVHSNSTATKKNGETLNMNAHAAPTDRHRSKTGASLEHPSSIGSKSLPSSSSLKFNESENNGCNGRKAPPSITGSAPPPSSSSSSSSDSTKSSSVPSSTTGRPSPSAFSSSSKEYLSSSILTTTTTTTTTIANITIIIM